MEQQGDVRQMLDYLREDLKGLRQDVRDDIKELRDELKQEIGKIATTVQQHTDSDATSFANQSSQLQGIENRLASLETSRNVVASFKDKVFGRTTGWIVALSSLALVIVEWWFRS